MYNIRTRASIKDDTTHELEKTVILWYSTNPISKREKERLGFKVMAIFMITTVKIHENPRGQKPSQHVPAASHVLQQRTKRKTWHNLNDRTKKLLAWHTRAYLRMGFLIGYTSQIAILHGQMITNHLIINKEYHLGYTIFSRHLTYVPWNIPDFFVMEITADHGIKNR